MIILSSMITESVSLTKQEGTVLALDGNKLYFKYRPRGEKKPMDHYAYVDLSATRTAFKSVNSDQVPAQRPRPRVEVDERVVMFGLWLIHHAADRKAFSNDYPRWSPAGQIESARFDRIDFDDFKQALLHMGKPSWGYQMQSWDITQEIIDQGQQIANDQRRKLEQEVDRHYQPFREADESLTAQILGVFNFVGEKKDLVIALKSSWGVDLKDSDVKLDKIGFTKAIHLPKTVEELIP